MSEMEKEGWSGKGGNYGLIGLEWTSVLLIRKRVEWKKKV